MVIGIMLTRAVCAFMILKLTFKSSAGDLCQSLLESWNMKRCSLVESAILTVFNARETCCSYFDLMLYWEHCLCWRVFNIGSVSCGSRGFPAEVVSTSI